MSNFLSVLIGGATLSVCFICVAIAAIMAVIETHGWPTRPFFIYSVRKKTTQNIVQREFLSEADRRPRLNKEAERTT